MIDFKAFELFYLTPSNVDTFAECMYRTYKLYAYYGYLRQFLTTMTVAPDGTFTLCDHSNLIETWNLIGIDTVLNNSNITLGKTLFTDFTLHEIQNITTARGEVTGGACGTVQTAYNGPTILSISFQTMRLNVRVNVFNEIGTMKDVTLESCNNNAVE